MTTKRKIFVVWHWYKKLTNDSQQPSIAVEDTLFDALYALAEHFDVTLISLNQHKLPSYRDEKNGVNYVFCQNQKEIIEYANLHRSDVLLLNHHSQPYDDLIEQLLPTTDTSILFYSSAIQLQPLDLLRFKLHHGLFAHPVSRVYKKINYHLVHHAYQKNELMHQTQLSPDRIFVSPKSANPSYFSPTKNGTKKWDTIYPGRCTEGYLKRPELAIKATDQLNMTLFMPGAKLKKTYPHVTTSTQWMDRNALNEAYNQSDVLLITTNYREMGPRVIPEAMMCNLPVVCCADSTACVSHVKKFGGYIAKPNVHDITKKLLLAKSTNVNTREELIRQDEPNAILRTLQNILEIPLKDSNV